VVYSNPLKIPLSVCRIYNVVVIGNGNPTLITPPVAKEFQLHEGLARLTRYNKWPTWCCSSHIRFSVHL